jgi:1A family penicillin-binding protein
VSQKTKKGILSRFWSHPSVKLLVLGGLLFSISGVVLWASLLKLPDFESFETRKIEQSTKIYDRTGEILLYDIHEGMKRSVVPFDEMSRFVKNAAVAIEDAEFYEHNGIKPLAFLRAIFANIQTLSFGQGGSTITQQVVKNSLLVQDKKISRKIKEWILSVKLEKELSKEEILALYLNEAPYGGSIYGVEEASRTFFDKRSIDLTLAESAYLTALPQAPTYYSPYGNHKSALDDRKFLVLKKMLEYGFITQEEFDSAQKEVVEFKPRSEKGILAPHFVQYVREYLEQNYGQKAIEERGLKVITTLDYDLQEKGEEIVKRYAFENIEKFNAENAALIAIDPKTGQILTMIGSRDYFDEEIDGNFNVTLAHRQPGSAFKPFVYATALKRGFTPDTVIFDVKTQFSTTCAASNVTSTGTCYSPGNYDNIFRGPMTFRNALAQSVNVPAVKVLYIAGLDASLQTARDLGITSLTNIAQYGLTLVLGGGEVTPLDMAGSYATFANEGVRNTPTPILRIEDRNGNIVEQYTNRGLSVLDKNIALQISDILSDNTARTPAFGINSPLYFAGYDVAAKTGTTNDYRDAWIVGYTPEIAVAAWAGNNDNSPMEKKVAGFTIAPLWNEFMYAFFEKYDSTPFEKPTYTDPKELKPTLRGIWQGGEVFIIDTISGKLATEFTPEETQKDIFVGGVHSILHWVNPKDPRGPRPTQPQENSQYASWEYSVRKWATDHGYIDDGYSTVPSGYDQIHTGVNIPLFIQNLKPSYTNTEQIVLTISNNDVNPLIRADLYIDGRYIEKTTTTPLLFSFTPSDVDIGSGIHEIRIVGFNTLYNSGESRGTLQIK